MFSTCFLPLCVILIKDWTFYAFFRFSSKPFSDVLIKRLSLVFPPNCKVVETLVTVRYIQGLKIFKVLHKELHSLLHFPTYEITSEFNQLQAQARYDLISRVLEFLRTAPTNIQAYTMGLTYVPRNMIKNLG